MQRRHSAGRRSGLLALSAFLLALAPLGCLDGPFARTNPHDGESPLELTIVGGRDTLRAIGEQVLFQLVTDPVTNGYTGAWSSSTNSLLLPRGSGVFEVMSLPGFASTVEIRATLGGNSATRNVVILPAP